jgi:hypothetical protein
MIRRAILAAGVLASPAAGAAAQGRNEQFYYPGGFNWSFRREYPEAARLFNAFDYGHAILYETLLTRPDASPERLEIEELTFLTSDLLRRPPRFAVAEEAIMPAYSRLAWRAKQMFDWAHVLHRQIYDVYADPGLSSERRVALVERITDYYLANREIAFTAVPKTMALMDEQYFSQVFRRRNPRFNGLIWAYHWLQVGLYEPLLEADERREAGAGAGDAREGVGWTVARFWEMVEGGLASLPQVMPMASGVAPRFSGRHSCAAVIFDNLHMLHDIISDILASPAVPRAGKAAAIEASLREFRDGTRNVMEMEHWRMMADHMGGVDKMGGVAGRPVSRSPARGSSP